MKNYAPPPQLPDSKFSVANLILLVPVIAGLLFFTATTDLCAQGGSGGGSGNAQTPWQTKGNSNVSSSDYIGTKFSDDLFIKTNSTERIRITGNGDIIFPSFAGTGDALLMRDINGKMKDHPIPSNPREVFTGGNQFVHISALAGWDYNGGTKNASLANYTGFGGNINPSEAVDVTGNMRASGDITAQKFLFDAEHGMRFTAADANLGIPPIYTLGPISALGNLSIPPCLNITPDPDNWIFKTGMIQSIASNGLSALTLSSAGWGGHGLIEVEGTEPNGGTNNALWINYFCGRNTLINTNTGLANRGGNIIMGERVMMYKSLQIGWTADPIDVMTALNILVYPENNVSRNGIKFNTWDVNAKLISINNPSLFNVYGDGRMAIGTDYVPTGYLLAVKGNIIAEDVIIKLRSDWPDYVLKPGYRRMTFEEQANFYFENHRLDGLPSADEIAKGNTGMSALLTGITKNLEETRLDALDLNKQVTELRNELKKRDKLIADLLIRVGQLEQKK